MAGGVENLKPFKKGDPRINRKGRPKSFDALRDLSQQIANEIISSKDGKTKMSRIEMILRDMSLSQDRKQRLAFIEIAYGKVPDELKIGFRWEDILPELPDDLLDELQKGEDPVTVILRYISMKGKHDRESSAPDPD